MKFENATKEGLSYQQYTELLEKLISIGKTTGQLQSESNVHYTELNQSRMKRIYKTTVIQSELLQTLEGLQRSQHWLVLSEGWCGDAAQNLPVMAKIADASEKINLKVISRDENPEIMNQFLTNGAKSIPILIFLNDSFVPMAHWGPRPEPAQQMMLDYKKGTGESYEDFQKRLQMWYNTDKTTTLQSEINSILKSL